MNWRTYEYSCSTYWYYRRYDWFLWINLLPSKRNRKILKNIQASKSIFKNQR